MHININKENVYVQTFKHIIQVHNTCTDEGCKLKT